MKSKTANTGERTAENADRNSYTEQLATYHFFTEYLKSLRLPKNSLIVDCACGTGYGLFHISSSMGSHFRYVGIDIDAPTVAECNSNYSNVHTKFVCGSILDSQVLAAASVAAYCSSQTIEHFYADNQKVVLQLQYRALSNQGVLLACVPNKPVYERFDPHNRFHLNELNYASFAALVDSQPWSKIQFFGQLTPEYQRGSGGGLRSNRALKALLALLPSRVVFMLANLINPRVTPDEIKIEPYVSERDLDYKMLIAIATK
jgi:ubiquinone/menaquinone biosynthesis C-methylase UbiE